jgi:hypothetical protein
LLPRFHRFWQLHPQGFRIASEVQTGLLDGDEAQRQGYSGSYYNYPNVRPAAALAHASNSIMQRAEN